MNSFGGFGSAIPQQQQQGGGGFSSFSSFSNNNTQMQQPQPVTAAQQPQPVYIYAKGAANKAHLSGGFASARSLGSMNDLMTDSALPVNTSAISIASSSSNNNVLSGAGAGGGSGGVAGGDLTQGQIKQLVEPLVQAMRQTTFYDIMSASSLVVVLDINSTVAVCVAAAQESRASCFLVWDPYCKEIGSGRFATILTLTNFIQILIHCHENQDQVNQLSSMPLRDLLKQEFARAKKKNNGSNSNSNNRVGLVNTSADAAPTSPPQSNNNLFNGASILHANPEICLYDLLSMMMENDINHIPILADSLNCASSENGGLLNSAAAVNQGNCDANHPPTNLLGISFLPQLLSQVVRVINNPSFSFNPSAAAVASSSSSSSQSQPCGYSSLFDVPLSQLASLSEPLARKLHSKDRDGAASWLLPTDTVHGALHRLIERGVQSLPIIDDSQGIIIDTFSRSDVIGLESLGVYNLNQPVKQALDYRSRHRNIVVCQLNDKIGDVVAHFVATGVRTIFVVGDNEEFVGQIQVSDLLKFLYNASK